jgi:hypothetical protein
VQLGPEWLLAFGHLDEWLELIRDIIQKHTARLRPENHSDWLGDGGIAEELGDVGV